MLLALLLLPCVGVAKGQEKQADAPLQAYLEILSPLESTQAFAQGYGYTSFIQRLES
ncbi:hypothetical protein [Helicobacter canis]|uniref:hypothetical protein n=1 Tax=Helicobacter canis TaxID=29419 RepID=UPI0026EE9BEE|nr:hypothetical protein [Helicobacter canis]